MQGLGSMPISLHGNSEQQKFWLPKIQSGDAISAFALSEPRSGSDVANLELMAKRERNGYVLNGEKTWISNGGIADVYTVFARTGEGPGAKGLSAFIVPANTPGLLIKERIEPKPCIAKEKSASPSCFAKVSRIRHRDLTSTFGCSSDMPE